MIEVEHLTKYYGSFPALRDVTFNVEKGEILGFLGPNGAGKTTTMRIITGFIPATSGIVRVAGFDVADKSLQARRHLGYLPETVPLYPELQVSEYLDFKGRISGLHNPKERRARMFEVMDLLNIGDVSNKLIGQLSRGYRQRVGLAQALLHNPDVLILDEPTVGLDPVQITEVRDLIRELGRDHTIILSTHLLPEVSMVCNRVVIINRGRLVALDTPVHLAQDVAASVVQIEARGVPEAVLSTLRTVPGVASARLASAPADGRTASAASPLADGVHSYEVEATGDMDLRSQVAAAVVGAGYDLLELKSVRPTLEQIFIRVISEEEEAAEELAEDYVQMAEAPDEPADDVEYDEDEAVDEDVAVVERPVAATRQRTQVTTKRRVRR